MNETGAQLPDPKLDGPDLSGLRRRIAAMRALAFLVIASERLLIAALPALAVVTAFLVFSWFGLWRFLPDGAKIAATLAFFLALGAALWRARALRWPSAAAVDRRLEEKSHLSHQAISIQTEEPTGDDPFGKALWKAHQARMAAKIKAIDSGLPSPDIARRDRYGARAVFVLLLVVAWSFSWVELRRAGTRRVRLFRPVRVPVRSPHRCLGDAAGLYRGRADLSFRRAGRNRRRA